MLCRALVAVVMVATCIAGSISGQSRSVEPERLPSDRPDSLRIRRISPGYICGGDCGDGFTQLHRRGLVEYFAGWSWPVPDATPVLRDSLASNTLDKIWAAAIDLGFRRVVAEAREIPCLAATHRIEVEVVFYFENGIERLQHSVDESGCTMMPRGNHLVRTRTLDSLFARMAGLTNDKLPWRPTR